MNFKHDRQAAILTARQWVEAEPVFLDTETTGLDDTAQIVDIAVINYDGAVLLDTFVHPGIHIPAAATRIHGITDEDVQHAPLFDAVLNQLWGILEGRTVIIYNQDYDIRLMQQSAYPSMTAQLIRDTQAIHCAMKLYARYHGDWNEYHQSYRWQKLSYAAKQCQIIVPPDLHRARADAELTRQVLYHLTEVQHG
jgi:DNA polymerase-3 subunit epsilon